MRHVVPSRKGGLNYITDVRLRLHPHLNLFCRLEPAMIELTKARAFAQQREVTSVFGAIENRLVPQV